MAERLQLLKKQDRLLWDKVCKQETATKKITMIKLNNINTAVEEAMAKTQSDNKTVQDYFKDLEQI